MVALALALVVAAITVVCVVLFWTHAWWFPPDISVHGPAIDHQFMLTLVVTGIVFVLAQLSLAYLVWRNRDRGGSRKAVYSHGNNRLEVTWTIAAFVLFVGLTFMGYHIWAGIHFVGAAPGAMPVEVWGQQFAWYFRYPGPDGRFGPTHVEKVDDAMANYLGLDRDHDPDSKDDIVTSTLAIPVNREIQIFLSSKDVTHSFFVRELRIKQDLVPGMVIPIHFMATKTGRYEIACAELCGLGHYRMRAFLQVMTQEDFDTWLANMAAAQ
jgi:cytochrome c oxidase subunit 2